MLNTVCTVYTVLICQVSLLPPLPLEYLTLSYLILSYLILSYLILSYFILSYLILSYHIISYLIISYIVFSILSCIHYSLDYIILFTPIGVSFVTFFTYQIVLLYYHHSSRKAITSTYFPRSDAILLKDFYDNLITSKLFEIDMNSSLNGIANSDSIGSGDGYGRTNSTSSSISQSCCLKANVLAQFKDVVVNCSSIHKL